MTQPQLSRDSFAASRHFIETQSRPLEIALFHHAFDGGAAASVISALQPYQNHDGGFGHALEPDFRARESSALCTSIAFQVLRSIQASPGNGLVKSGVTYLLSTLNRKTDHWRIIPAASSPAPHAPWWDQVGREAELVSFSLNPTIELLGYLYDYLAESQLDVLSPVAEHVLSYLSGLDKIIMHDLLCCLRMLQTKSLPYQIERPLRQILVQLVDKTISYDPSQWSGYALRPLQVVNDPASPFMAGREDAVAANLEYEISSQNQDGSWSPNWSWGDAYPDAWPIACREWSGVLTLEKLLLLKRFHSIEGFD